MSDVATTNWTDTLLPPDAVLRDIITSLEKSGLQIVLVCTEDRALLGTITDGDLRRALLRGTDLSSPVSEVMHTTPLVVGTDMTREMVLNLMRVNKLHQLPVLDDGKRLVGLHVWKEILAPTRHDNTVVIMAGGFGKRMRPFTDTCPKPMLEVAGKPMLEHIVLRAVADGFSRFVISLHYLPDVITDYFGDGSRWGAQIRYVREDSPLGTAGALSLMDPPPDLPFIVTNGDVMTDIRYTDMLEFHNSHGAAATMAVRQHEWQHPYGVVKTKGIAISGFEEKPIYRSHVNAGIYVLDPGTLDMLRQNEVCDMPTLFTRVQEAGKRAIAYPMHEVWMDVGRPEDLAYANREQSE